MSSPTAEMRAATDREIATRGVNLAALSKPEQAAVLRDVIRDVYAPANLVGLIQQYQNDSRTKGE